MSLITNVRMVSYLTCVHAGSSQPLNSHAVCWQDPLGYWRGFWRPLRVISFLLFPVHSLALQVATGFLLGPTRKNVNAGHSSSVMGDVTKLLLETSMQQVREV